MKRFFGRSKRFFGWSCYRGGFEVFIACEDVDLQVWCFLTWWTFGIWQERSGISGDRHDIAIGFGPIQVRILPHSKGRSA